MTVTLAYYIAFIALGLVGASLGPTLPGLADQTGTQLSEIGFLFTTRSLGYLLGATFGGRLYDRRSGNLLMGLALLLMAAAMAIIPAVPLLWILAGVLLVIGLGEGLLDVGGNTLIVWEHREKVGPFMNSLHFFFGVGAFLAPLIVAQLVFWGGEILWTYWLIAFLIFPMGLWMLRLPSPVQPRTENETESNARINYKLVSLVVIFFLLYVGAEISFGGWVFTFAVRSGMASEVAAAYLTSGFWVAFTVARLISIPLGSRLRPRTVLQLSITGALVSLGVMLLWPDRLAVLWVGALGFGFSIAAIFPTMLTYVGRRMAVTGRVTGYFFFGATIGSMFLPWAIGQLIENVGPTSMLWVIALDMLLAAAILMVIGLGSRASQDGHAVRVNQVTSGE